MQALLALEDGLVLRGRSFTGPGEALGEVVFNTAMTGYQEILTDPSYKGQIVTMTYPMMGNYGVNPEDIESAGIQVEGFIVKEYHHQPSNWRAKGDLAEYLKAAGKLGVEGFDTRAITKRLRQVGAMRGIISTLDLDAERLVRRVKEEVPDMNGLDLVPLVTCQTPYWWDEGVWDASRQKADFCVAPPAPKAPPVAKAARLCTLKDLQSLWAQRSGKKVILYDYGVKYNIIRSLKVRGLEVLVVPATTPAADILALNPDGIVLSNGPGDPAAVTYAHRQCPAMPGAKAHVRHLPGPPAHGPGPGGQDLQAQVRPPGRQPAREKPGHRPGGDHQPEPRLRGGPGLHPRPRGGADPRQPERQHPGGPAPPETGSLFGAIPPRGLARAPMTPIICSMSLWKRFWEIAKAGDIYPH